MRLHVRRRDGSPARLPSHPYAIDRPCRLTINRPPQTGPRQQRCSARHHHHHHHHQHLTTRPFAVHRRVTARVARQPLARASMAAAYRAIRCSATPGGRQAAAPIKSCRSNPRLLRRASMAVCQGVRRIFGRATFRMVGSARAPHPNRRHAIATASPNSRELRTRAILPNGCHQSPRGARTAVGSAAQCRRPI